MHLLKKYFIWIIILSLPLYSCKNNKGIKIKSPDKAYVFNLNVKDSISYNVQWNGEPIIDQSSLGFKLTDGTTLGNEITVQRIEQQKQNNQWTPVYGQQDRYTDYYNETLIQFTCKNWSGNIAIRVRAYNEGVAFRYEIKSEKELDVEAELTEFSYPLNPTIWSSKFAQSKIEKQKLSQLEYIAERPLLAQLSDTLFSAIGEAALIDFARMKLKKLDSKKHTLVASLDIGKKNDSQLRISANGYNTPWRYIMAGKTPGQILENNHLLLNLNEKNKIAQTSYIKPGKVIREITLTTQGGIACVDFAAKHNLQFIEFDAGWYGNEYDNNSDATTVTVDPRRSPGPLDLPYVIQYAKKKGIGVILYVNRRALEKQLDEILPLAKSWGVAGLKYGFVNVGSQKWTTWLHEAVQKAAEHELMIDIHDEYRPTGFSRTYPNLMTQEGIRGDEESYPNDGVINTIFTRMIGGAADQTYCYFADRVQNKMGSHASQMAKAVCIYSPWQFIYWYDRPYGSPIKKGGAGGTKGIIREIEDLRFFDELPTVWNDTRIIEGYPGEYVAIARKKGDKWFLGALSGNKEYKLSLKLDFLDETQQYKAIIFSDDESLNTKTNVKILEIDVNNKTILNQMILKQNGIAIIFTPKK